MSGDGDRQSVLRTTKVRTALKGDSSWIMRRKEQESQEEEKPWMAEVRASRANNTETSPVSSPTTKQPQTTTQTDTERSKTPTSGYMIRGVFTKTDTKPVSSTSTNGYSGTTSSFVKKPSDVYKKIAPHTVRPTTENTDNSEPQLSPEEQERRREAASSVLKRSAVRQRSYVLSAAKKFEAPEKEDSPPPENVTSFVAKRIVITDEETNNGPDAQETVSVPAPVTHSPTSQTRQEESMDGPVPTVTDEPKSTPQQSADAVAALSDSLISFDAEPSSTDKAGAQTEVEPEEEQKEEPEGVQTVSSAAVQSVPEPGNGLDNDDLFDLAQSTKEQNVDLSPTDTYPDLLMRDPSLLPQTEKTEGTLDILADDVIPIDTSATTLSTDDTYRYDEKKGEEEEEEEEEEQPNPLDSPTQPVNVTTEVVTIIEDISEDKTDPEDMWGMHTIQTAITDTSSADPFDPISKETESTKSPVDLFDPLVNSSNDISSDALISLADDVIPIDTDRKTLSSDRSWAPSDSEAQDPPSADQEQEGEQQSYTLVTFEKKSNENDSPWDRWMSPTVYTTDDSPEDDTDTQTHTTITTISDTNDDLNSPMDGTLISTEQGPKSPETKKGFVYLKEYVNVAEPSDRDSDYITSSIQSNLNSSYSSAGMSECTYCGQLVGNDARITIEHLNISCHPECFKCGICSKPMGDLLYNMFLHGGTVHCESCYSNVL
ncbi:zinc finger protein 185 [Chanos chanos]|uniref:Zinc finger protein 185 n=1 Tax=Chanos chanos TaxID=29144 RepID=A0A6J2WVS0_CHACN|nr:zinc finger protein 185-like [Chanos chanos]